MKGYRLTSSGQTGQSENDPGFLDLGTEISKMRAAHEFIGRIDAAPTSAKMFS